MHKNGGKGWNPGTGCATIACIAQPDGMRGRKGGSEHDACD